MCAANCVILDIRLCRGCRRDAFAEAHVVRARVRAHAVQVTPARSQLDAFCAALGIDQRTDVPTAFRALLPCVACDTSVVDFAPETLAEHGVSTLVWRRLGRFLVQLARGDATCTNVLASRECQDAKAQWLASDPARASAGKSDRVQSEQAQATQARVLMPRAA